MTFKTSYHNTFIFKILNFGVFQPVGDPQFSFAPQYRFTKLHNLDLQRFQFDALKSYGAGVDTLYTRRGKIVIIQNTEY